MFVVLPLTIDDASGRLTTTNIAFPDATVGEANWNAATNYTAGVSTVTRPNFHVYESVTGGIDAGLPEATPAKWLDLGFANRWRLFDTLRNTQSTRAAGPIIVEITPGKRIDSVGLLAVEATKIRVEAHDTVGGALIYDSLDVDMSARNTVSWYGYFFNPFRYVPSIAFFDLPPVSTIKVKVTITNDSGTARIGDLIVGLKQYIGKVKYDAEDDETNFSKIERDFDGTVSLTQRRSVPKTNQVCYIEKPLVPAVRAARRDLNAVPALYSGLEDADDEYFDSLLIKGIYKRWSISLKHQDMAESIMELEEI